MSLGQNKLLSSTILTVVVIVIATRIVEMRSPALSRVIAISMPARIVPDRNRLAVRSFEVILASGLSAASTVDIRTNSGRLLTDGDSVLPLGISKGAPSPLLPTAIVVDAEAEGCDRVAVEARDFQVEDGGGRDKAGVDMGDQDGAGEARDPLAGTKIGEGCPGLAVERPDGMVGRAHEGRGRALEGDCGQAMSDGPEASGDFPRHGGRPGPQGRDGEDLREPAERGVGGLQAEETARGEALILGPTPSRPGSRVTLVRAAHYPPSIGAGEVRKTTRPLNHVILRPPAWTSAPCPPSHQTSLVGPPNRVRSTPRYSSAASSHSSGTLMVSPSPNSTWYTVSPMAAP